MDNQQNAINDQKQNFDQAENHDECYKRQIVIPYEHNQDLLNHKYSGSDLGIMYGRFWSPLATWAVSKLPRYLAPNTITTLGFCHAIAPLIVNYCVNGLQMVGELPKWYLFFATYCFFMYRLFDEMDGKQARRTGNSSPLGLLFDHGFDCFVVSVQIMIFLPIVQCGNNSIALFVLISGYAGFFFATLEEYYVGTLKLPPFNAVSDGSIILIIIMLITGFTGNSYFATILFDGSWLGIDGITELTLGCFLMLVITVISTITALASIYGIIRSKYQPLETQAESVEFGKFTLEVLGFITYATVWYLLGFIGPKSLRGVPENPVSPATTQAEIDALGMGNFILYLLMFSFVNVHQSMDVQLSHCTRQKYSPFTKIWLFAVLSIAVIYFISLAQKDDQSKPDMTLYIKIVVTCIAIFQWSFILKTVQELTQILKIRVFFVKKETTEQLLEKQTKNTDNQVEDTVTTTTEP